MRLLETPKHWTTFGVVKFERNSVVAIRAKDGKVLVDFNRGIPYFMTETPYSGETWDVRGNAPRFIRLADRIKKLPSKLKKNKIVMVYFSYNTHKNTSITTGTPIKNLVKSDKLLYVKKINGVEVYQWNENRNLKVII